MKRNLIPILIMLTVFLFACGVGSGSEDASAPATQPDSAPMPTSTPEPLLTNIEPTSIPDLTAACKIQPYSFTNVGLGLPNPTFKLP